MRSLDVGELTGLLLGKSEMPNSDTKWESIIRVAKQAGVLSRLAMQLSKSDKIDELPEFPKKHLISSIRHANLLASQVRYEAHYLNEKLAELKVQPIFLKGAAYLLADCPAGDGRVFSDIDLLVDKIHIGNVERKLLLYGWFCDKQDEYDQDYYRKWAHEIPPLKHAARGTSLDVHHNIIPPISGKAPSMNLFTENCIGTKDGFKVLSPPAMTLHSAVHLFYQEEYSHGFRDLNDLHLMFEGFSSHSYWNQLIELSIKTDFKLELFLALRYCQKVFDTHIPEDIHSIVDSWFSSTVKQFILDWIFTRALLPHHSLCAPAGTNIANFLALCRGHLIKMPFKILIKHTLHKLWQQILILFAGHGVNKKSDEKEMQI